MDDELTPRDVREQQKRRKDNAQAALGCGVLVLFVLLWYSASGGGGDDAAAPSYPVVSSTLTGRATLAPVQGVPAGGAHERLVTRTLISPWPFTVESGTLRCRSGQAVTFEAGGREYGVNGTAQARYPKLLPIWADDPVLGNGLKVDISSMLNAGLALC
ncbi:DUF2511 domain-containing protein [Kitasatospora sp. NPDC127116]|uniref:DUF2511 domain-containing protein n=1 Tax=Kitasatospora sp. NPDC127116 TaxID=3345367 RepID=UPI0036340177